MPQDIKDKISLKLKGRVFSEEHLKRKSDSQKKEIIINDVVYDSGREAAKHFGVSPSCIIKWLKNGKALYKKNQ